MLQVSEAEVKQEVGEWMKNTCNELFERWSVELTREEKEVWLWNALVGMAKIQQRRKAKAI